MKCHVKVSLGMARSLVFSILAIFSVILLSQCTWNTRRQPSVLVVAVEGLSFENVSCTSGESNERDGWKVFCEESVRFTHAYTPSLMSQATMASLMTARYPHEHGVWHNGSQFLSAKVNTVAELAIDKGFRTSFFSGGPPIWRKSGLSQGFEVFEDNVAIGLNKYYRPAKKNFELFFQWIDRIANRDSFFSMVYLPDLQFPEATTVDDLGEVRGQNIESQHKELSETLAYLVNGLKKRKRWNNSYVIVVGLNGKIKRDRQGEIETMSLFSETTQVAMFIKPVRKERDTGIEWKIDKNVSLVDLSATLFDIVSNETPSPPGRRLEVVSLLPVLKKPKVTWDANRMIVIESGWPLWRGIGNSRFAVRKSQFLFMFDEKVSIYNTLIDRNEITPMIESDPNWLGVYEEIKSYLSNKGFTSWNAPTPALIEKLKVAGKLWLSNEYTEDINQRLLHLVRTRQWDTQVAGWQALMAIQKKNWRELKTLGARTQIPVWEYVAAKNMGENPEINGLSGCALLFANSSFLDEQKRECKDRLLIKLMRWLRAKNSSSKLKLQEEFLKYYRYIVIDNSIAKMNYANSLRWHVPLDSPGMPELADLYLEMPEMKSYKEIVQARFPVNF